MTLKRYGISENTDTTWSVIDFHEHRAGEMEGQSLIRVSFDLATSLKELLNLKVVRGASY